MSDDKKQYVLGEDCGSQEVMKVGGWVSRHGRFYGTDKAAADFDGATTRRCACGNLTRTRSHMTCDACRDRADEATYAARAPVKWNGTDPIYSNKADKWLFSEDDLIELWCNEDPDANPDVSLNQMFLDLQIMICEPVKCVALAPDIEDIEADENLEDGVEFPAAVYKAFNDLKVALEAIEAPAYWQISNFRAIE